LLEVRCFNDSRIDEIPLLLLLTATTLEDVEGHKSKAKTPSLMQLLMTHSQLLEGFKCESQTENNGRVRSRTTLPGSQHFGGVKGCAGTPRWD